MDLKRKLSDLREMHENGLVSKEVYEKQQQALLSGSATIAIGEAISAVKKPVSAIYKIGIAVLTVFGTMWVVYHFTNRTGKEAVSQFAAITGIERQIIPWNDRAEKSVRRTIEGNKSTIAEAVQKLTHPTGSSPSLELSDVRKFDNKIVVKISVYWSGGITGSRYATVVDWQFDETAHISARIVSDSAPFKVANSNAAALDNYFRDKVIPVVRSGLGD